MLAFKNKKSRTFVNNIYIYVCGIDRVVFVGQMLRILHLKIKKGFDFFKKEEKLVQNPKTPPFVNMRLFAGTTAVPCYGTGCTPLLHGLYRIMARAVPYYGTGCYGTGCTLLLHGAWATTWTGLVEIARAVPHV